MQRLRRWLAQLGVQRAIILLALLLVTPSLNTGVVADDHFHQILAGPAPNILRATPTTFDLFTFADGNPDTVRRYRNAGIFPWWADAQVKLRFWRPLSALTHILDFRAWPGSPMAMHAQNIFWFMLALFAVAQFYRRFCLDWIAGLALLLYAIDDTHGPAVGWIANRNAMIALALSLPAITFYDRWRRDRFALGAWLSPLFFALALCAGESAIAVVAYLFAYACCIETGPLRARFLPLVPHALVLVAWRATYVALGYGAAHSDVYLDPLRDAGAFLHALPARFCFLLAGQLALPWSEFASLYSYFGPHVFAWMLAIVIAILLLLALAFRSLVVADRTARFFALGMLLAVVPICSTFPADRLLWFVGLGAMGLIALFIARGSKRWPTRIAIFALVALHLVLAPPLLALRSRSMVTVNTPLARANDTLPKTADIAGKTIVLVNPPADIFAGYLAMMRTSRGEPTPRNFFWLTTGTSGVALTRQDARTLIAQPQHGFLENITEQLLRSPRRPFRAGDHIVLDDVTIEILEMKAGRPLSARFTFATPLEDPRRIFFAWYGTTGYAPIELPKIGEQLTLPPIDFLAALLAPPPR